MFSVDVLAAKGPTRVWLPLPSSASYQRVSNLDWAAGTARENVVTRDGVRILTTSWHAAAPTKAVTLTMRLSTQDRTVPLVAPAGKTIPLPENIYQRYVKPTRWIPTDGLVRDTALKIVRGRTEQFFGAWEMNWIACNNGHDIVLPYSTGKTLPFFMYPQAEVSRVRRDSLDPAAFQYRITAREIV